MALSNPFKMEFTKSLLEPTPTSIEDCLAPSKETQRLLDWSASAIKTGNILSIIFLIYRIITSVESSNVVVGTYYYRTEFDAGIFFGLLVIDIFYTVLYWASFWVIATILRSFAGLLYNTGKSARIQEYQTRLSLTGIIPQGKQDLGDLPPL